MNEKITIEPGGTHSWKCACGNTPDSSGFFPCLSDGTQVEPLINGPWDGKLYICNQGGRILNQTNLEIVGRAPQWPAKR